MLLCLETSIQQISDRYRPAGRELAPWPIQPGFSEEEISIVEDSLGTSLPPSFRQTVTEWNFLKTAVGNVAITGSESLTEWIVRHKSALPHDYTQTPIVPIAQSDAHNYFLNLTDGTVLAYGIDTPKAGLLSVAGSFSLFYQGLATLNLSMLGTSHCLQMAPIIAEAVKAPEAAYYWTLFASSAA